MDTSDEGPAARTAGELHDEAREVGRLVAALLSRHGVPERSHASRVAEVLGLNDATARKKLRGAVGWRLLEVQTLAAHFDEGLHTVFAEAVRPPVPAAPAAAPATFLLGGRQLACMARIGAPLGYRAAAAIAAVQTHTGWWLGVPRELPDGPRHAVLQVELAPTEAETQPRIAVLDDDALLADTVADFFLAAGYACEAFYTSRALVQACSERRYDGFVVDWLLGGGETAQQVCREIRQAHPTAPLLLLTGQLRDGTANESELAATMRQHDVLLFEKPVYPRVLAAAIDNRLRM
ncbi:helix-turn-helix domain-containing protein [Aquabacterium sp. A7-Y]|uniref:response regulator n=1 Tax=Aquabacterium sp. A7-Y TaxID=1349605 RepID=UPI00223DFD74|nr:helix-turn-helix domain-containing protein [Aquabacterium sp. A7-Y]MCW7539896.1 helix-turn-helix domain-containing protein [Aquabacterium sp. A7-Y]